MYVYVSHLCIMVQVAVAAAAVAASATAAVVWFCIMLQERIGNKKLAAIQRGNQYNLAREIRQAQENLVNARADEDRQMSELTTARRSTLRGEAGRVRAGLFAAQQAYNSMQK